MLRYFYGVYEVDAKGAVSLIPHKFFGAGLFKGTRFCLLQSIRGNSANLNRNSMGYSIEFLLINYLNDYELRRRLAIALTLCLASALRNQLPGESSETKNNFMERELVQPTFLNLNCEREWKTLKNDP